MRAPLLQNRLLFRTLFLALMLGACAYFISKPRTFWDMLPYMGSVVALDDHDSAYVHRTTYAEFERYASPEMKAAMIGGHPYCKTLSENADYFHQHLSFFCVKLLYVHLSRLFYLCGVPLFYAVLLPVLLSFLLIGLFTYRWLELYFAPALACAISVALLVCEFNLQAFRIASPDALSGLFLLLTAYVLLEKKQVWPAIAFLIPAVLARPDNVLFSAALLGGLAALLFKSEKKIAGICLLLLVVTGGLALLMSQMSGYDAYTMFYRAFVDLVVNPADVNPAFDWDTYLGGVQRGLRVSAGKMANYLLLAGTGLFIFLRRVKLRSLEGIWLSALFLSLAGRIILHPAFEGRYIFSFLLVLLILIIIEAGKRTGLVQQTQQA